jgi:hypothetical protein
MVYGEQATGAGMTGSGFVMQDTNILKCDSSILGNRNSTEMSCMTLVDGGKPQPYDWGKIEPVYTQVMNMMTNIYQDIQTPNQVPTAKEMQLVNSTAAPIFRYLLTGASAFHRSNPFAQDPKLANYAGYLATSFVAHNVEAMVDSIVSSLDGPATNGGADAKKMAYINHVKEVRNQVQLIADEADAAMSNIIDMQERSQQYERIIISRMSAAMLNSAMYQ